MSRVQAIPLFDRRVIGDRPAQFAALALLSPTRSASGLVDRAIAQLPGALTQRRVA